MQQNGALEGFSKRWRIVPLTRAWTGLLNTLGINRAVFFTLLNRGWGLLNGVVTIALVVTYLTAEVQGYYYTFLSLLMMQTLLEFGFGVVLIQFVSHEVAHLNLDESGKVGGDEVAKQRLASLIRLALKWYLILSLVFFFGLGVFGSWFLKPAASGVSVYRPWWILCAGVGISVFAIPLRCLLEGSNQVYESQKIALVAGVMAAGAGWLAIVGGANLYALAIAAVVTGSISCGLLILRCRSFLGTLNSQRVADVVSSISWRREIWPQQWRIGLSWFSGYFMYQSFVPIAFRVQGPIVAGQLGVALQIYNANNLIAGAFLTAAGPRMGMLGAKRNYEGLRALVRKTWLQSTATALILSSTIVLSLFLLKWLHLRQFNRFPPLLVVLIFLAVSIMQQLMAVETTAIRFQKIDPFVSNGILCAVLVLASNILAGVMFGQRGVSLGFAIVILGCALPWCHYLYGRALADMSRYENR